jgi:DNA repair exonuclease SbcCD ATPase subunit
MSQIDSFKSDGTPRTHSRSLWILGGGLAVALGCNLYQAVQNRHEQRDLAMLQQSTEKQIAKLTDAESAEVQLNQQRFEAMQSGLKTDLEGATSAAIRQARSEMKRSNTQMAANIEERRREFEEKNQAVASQLADLKQDTSTKLEDTSSKLQTTNTKLDQVSSDMDKTSSDLKRMVGDMGVMSGDIATNGKQLAALKELGERNYFEFDLSKSKTPQKVGDIRVALRNADPKHSRFTLQVFADDKIVEKKDRTLNEPVQLYVAGNRQPYEIVVNQIKNNEVIGYLATPKVKTPRGQSTTAGGF